MFKSGPYGREGNVLSPRAKRGQKKKKKKKIQNSVLTYRPNMAVCFFFFFFLAPFGPVGEYIFGPAIRARFKHADCYQSACSSLALMAGIRSVLLGGSVEITRFGFCHFIMTRFEHYKLCFSQQAPHKYVLALCHYKLPFVFFSLFFFLAQFGPPLNMPIGTNRHVRPRANTG